MQAEIITIGDELLIGQVVDTNSAWLGRTLGEDGIKVTQITSIQDDADQISRTVNEALARVSIVLVTGGLGPTRDDITKHTLAELFGMRLVRDEQVYETVRRQLAVRGIAFNELNRGQALVPDGCTVLPNRNGTAPGMWFERGGKILVSMPGVPFEMKALVTDEVLPRLRTHFSLHANVHRTATTFGLAESILAERIAPWEAALPANLRLAYLPSALCIRLRLSAYETDPEKARSEIGRQFDRLTGLIPHYLVGYGDDTLESVTGSLLRSRGETLATAESCHGRQHRTPFHRDARSLRLLPGRRSGLFERGENRAAGGRSRQPEPIRRREPERRRTDGGRGAPRDRRHIRHLHDRHRGSHGRHAR